MRTSGSAWRTAATVLASALVGVLAFVVARGSMLPGDPGSVPPDESLRLMLLLFGDLLLGLVALAVLPVALRARDAWWTLAAGVAVVATTAVSSLAMAACVVVLASFAGRRPLPWFWTLTGVFFAAVALSVLVIEPEPVDPGMATPWWAVVLIAASVPAVAGPVGAAQRSRRELIRSLRNEAATARRERAAHAEQVRAAERTRIAREMHDTLSHRLSLISLHAGALEYRADLDPQTVRSTATLVRETARTASQELRTVLTVLREEDHGTTPDATLAALEDLVATARDSGTPVELTASGPLAERTAADLPEVTSRAVFRFFQECLTNARKHAPGRPVRLGLSGGPGPGIVLTAENPSVAGPRAGEGGFGLIGLRERVELLGGRLEVRPAGGTFAVEAWLPWQG